MARDLGEAVLRIRIQLDKFDADAILKKLDPLKDGLAKFAQETNAKMAGLVGQNGSLTKLANDLSTVAAALQQIKNASNVLKPLAAYQKAMQSGGGLSLGGGAREFLSEINRVDQVITALQNKQKKNNGVLSAQEEQTLRAAQERLRVLNAIDKRKPGLSLGDLGEKQVRELNKILSLFDKMPKSIEDTKARLKLLAEASNDWSRTFLPQSTIDRIRKSGEALLKVQEVAQSTKAIESMKGLSDISGKVENKLRKIAAAFALAIPGQTRLAAATQAYANQFESLIKSETKASVAGRDFAKTKAEIADAEKRLQAYILRGIKDTELRTAAENALKIAIENRTRALANSIQKSTAKQMSDSAGLAIGSGDVGKMRKAKEELDTYFKSISSGSKISAKDLDVVRVALNRLNNAIEQTEKKGEFRFLQNLRQSFQSVSSGVAQVGEQIRRVSFILRDVGRQMLTFGQAMVGFLKPNIDAFAQFEQGVVDILAITGNLREGFEEAGVISSGLAKQILELAASSRFSSAEIADAAKTLALAGFTLEQIQGSLKSLTTLAAATGASLAEAANIVVSTMTTFQVEAEESARIADIFTAAVTRSNTNLNKLQESLKVVAPTAAAMGQEIQGTVAALSSLANAGIKGSSAGTGLSRIMTQLVEKSGKLDVMLRALGSSFDEINPETVGIVDIIKRFEELNLSTAQLLEIFDLRAFRSFQAIMQQGADSVALLNEQLLQSSNIAERIATLRLKTLAASMELLGDAVNALRVRLGELIAKEFKFLVDSLAKITESITQLSEKHRERFAQFVKILAGFSAVALTLGTALFGVGSAASFAAVPFIALGSVLTTISAIVTGAITYITAAGLALTALAPILLTITAAFIALSVVVSGLTAAFVGTFAAISIAVSQNFEMLISYVQSWSALFMEMGSEIINSFLRGWNLGKIRIMESFQALLNQLTSMGLGFKTDLSSLLSDGAEGFATGLTILFASILDGITAVLKALDESRPAFAATFEAISMLFSALGGIAGFVSMLDWFADLSEVLKAIAGTIGTLLLPAIGALVFAFGPILVKLALISAAILALSALFQTAVGWGEAIRGFFTGSVVDSAKAIEKLNQAIEENNRLMANLRKSAEETASIIKSESDVQLRQVDIFIDSLREADKTLKDLSGSSSSGIAKAQEVARDALSGRLEEQIETLTETRDAIILRVREITALDSDTAGPIIAALQAQEKAMTERINNLSRLGKSLEKTNSIVMNSIKSGGKGAEQELKNLLEQKDLYDQIFEGVSEASLSIGDENVFEFLKETNDEAFQALQKLTDQINIEFKDSLEQPFKLDTYEDYIKLLEFTQKDVAGASQSTQEYITQVQALMPVLEKMRAEFPEFSELDFGDPKNREKFLEFLNKAKGMMGEQIKQALEQEKKKEELLEIEKRLSDSQLNTFQKAIKAHTDEIATIQEKIEAQRMYLRGQETALLLELQRGKLTEERAKNAVKELQDTQDAIAENARMAVNAEATAAKEKAEIEKEFEDKRTQNREAILEKELEVTTDTQRRIELRREIINSKEERDRRNAIKELQDNYNLEDAAQRKLFEQEKARLDNAWEAAKQKDLQNMEDEENKKTAEDVNKMAEKRVDLEQEIVNNFAKQVTSLSQMAQLMIFIEKLQKRRIGLARKAMEDQIKADRAFAEVQKKAALPGPAGDLARKALGGKKRRAEFAAGVANAAAAQAGIQGGAVPMNQQAFFDQFMVGLNAMVDRLKANPITIPAVFAVDFMIKDLLKRMRDAKIKIAAELPLDPGAHGGKSLVGVNMGTIINNDNSTVNINTRILSPEMVRQFSIL